MSSTRWIEILRRAMGGESTPPFRGFHSSPHQFDRFDSAYIGTGEGAQVRGQGLYVAENPETAAAYRESLARPTLQIGGMDDARLLAGMEGDELWLARGLYDNILRNGFTEPGLARLQTAYDDAGALEGPLLRQWREMGIQRNPGTNTYEIDLHLDPRRVGHQERLLDEQPLPVQEAVRGLGDAWGWNVAPHGRLQSELDMMLSRRQQDLFDDNAIAGLPPYDPVFDRMTGGAHTAALMRAARIQAAREQAQQLQQRGMQAHIYDDAGSRGTGGGTHNMVVLPGEESRMEILQRWGLLGTLGGGGAAAALGGEN